MFLPLLLLGQAPGYMGKKIFIGGGVTYSPVFSDLIFSDDQYGYQSNKAKYTNYKGESKSIFLPPLTYSGNIQYVISEHNTLQFGVGFQKIGLLAVDPEYDPNDYYDPYWGAYYGEPYHSTFTGSNKFDYARASYTKLSFGYTHSDATAPIGVFYGNTLNFLIANIEAVDTFATVYKLGKAYDVGYTFTYGYRRVIKDVIVLETSTDVSLYFGGFFGYFGAHDEINSVKKLKQLAISSHYFNNIATLRVSAYYLF